MAGSICLFKITIRPTTQKQATARIASALLSTFIFVVARLKELGQYPRSAYEKHHRSDHSVRSQHDIDRPGLLSRRHASDRSHHRHHCRSRCLGFRRLWQCIRRLSKECSNLKSGLTIRMATLKASRRRGFPRLELTISVATAALSPAVAA